jgi:hypothetical protein
MDLEPLQDRILICVDCNEEFVFTVSAQEYFLEKGFTEEPKRCKSCYTQLKKEKRQQQKVATRRTHNGRNRVPVANSRNGNVRSR